MPESSGDEQEQNPSSATDAGTGAGTDAGASAVPYRHRRRWRILRWVALGLGLVLVGADDPGAMLAHTAAAHRLGIPVAADPSQQLARLDRGQARQLVAGAAWLFTNEYEAALLCERTGWSRTEVLRQVGTWVTTLGAAGVTVASAAGGEVAVAAVRPGAVADPTGAGDGFRAGFLAGLAWSWEPVQAARLGCALAATVLESVGTQEYKLAPADLTARIGQAYGPQAAGAARARLAGAR